MLVSLILCLATLQTPDSKLLIEAGKNLGVQSVKTGKYNDVVQEEAQQYADYMARICRQDGHGGWNNRMNRLIRRFPGHRFQEITAESWSWQDNKTSSFEMYKCWRQSSGHWFVANGRADIYGYAMCKGRNKVFYGVGIIGRRR